MKRFVFLRAALVGATLLVAGLLATPVAEAELVVDTSPGNGAAPATLGGVTMVPSTQDACPSTGGAVTDAPATPASTFSFDSPMRLYTIGNGWCSTNWAGGFYNGRVYDTPGTSVTGDTLTITLPTPMSAVYFYAQQSEFSDLGLPTVTLTATGQDGASVFSNPIPGEAHRCQTGGGGT